MKRLKAALKLIFEDTIVLIVIIIFGSGVFYLIEFLPASENVKNYLHIVHNWFIIIMVIILVGSTIINFLRFKFEEFSKKDEENNQ